MIATMMTSSIGQEVCGWTAGGLVGAGAAGCGTPAEVAGVDILSSIVDWLGFAKTRAVRCLRRV